MQKSVLIIGAGITGCVIANELNKYDVHCTIVDKRSEIGGNCATETIHGITVQKYGVHIFHTDYDYVHSYISSFTNVRDVKYRVLAMINGRLISFPINLLTINQLYPELTDPMQIKILLSDDGFKKKLYDIFYEGYTLKQWGIELKDIDRSVIDRIPIRYTYDDCYFHDAKHEFVPNYERLFECLASGSDIVLNTEVKYGEFKLNYDLIVLTGSLDSFLNFEFGELPYRSLRFDKQIYKKEYYQGAHVIHYPESNVEYTRSIEHKLLLNEQSDHTVVSFEYPINDVGNPYYPINENDKSLWFKYYSHLKRIDKRIIPAGRLGLYSYMNMDIAVLSAHTTVRHILGELCLTTIPHPIRKWRPPSY